MTNRFAVLAKPILTPDVEPKASASQFTMNVIMLPRKMDQDTDIGGPNHRFPVTQHSAIIAARSQDRQVRERAFATIVEGLLETCLQIHSTQVAGSKRRCEGF